MRRMIAGLLFLLMACLAMPAGAAAEWELGDKAIVANCNEYVSLRKSAAVSSKRIEKIGLDETVNVLGISINDFLLVEHNGKLGMLIRPI